MRGPLFLPFSYGFAKGCTTPAPPPMPYASRPLKFLWHKGIVERWLPSPERTPPRCHLSNRRESLAGGMQIAGFARDS
jgi:hypothetical protein